MESLERFLTRITVAPRTVNRQSSEELEKPSYDEQQHLQFGHDDVDNPKNWSLARKCYISAVVMLLVVNATFSSSAPTGAIEGISEEFQVSQEAAGLVTTLFLLGYCAGPLVWAPLSEFYG